MAKWLIRWQKMATDNCIWLITLLALHWRMIRHALTLEVCCKNAGLCRIRRWWGVNRSRVVPLRLGNSLGHESCFHVTSENTVYHGVSLFPLSSSRWSMLIIKHNYIICTTFTYIYIYYMYVLALHRMVYWYIATQTSPSMKIFRFAAKTIANCTHKSSTKILKKKRRLWPTSIRLGCLATCFATNLLGHHGCSRLGCICCMRGFLEVGDEESESIKMESMRCQILHDCHM